LELLSTNREGFRRPRQIPAPSFEKTVTQEIHRITELTPMIEMTEEINKEKEMLVSRAQGTMPDASKIAVTLLTGGGDRPYAFGLATELIRSGAVLDLVGSNDLDSPEFHGRPQVRFLNLRGDQRPEVSSAKKVLRVLSYYIRLIRYSLTSKPKIFHVLWNNKFQSFDRIVLMLYYKVLGKKIALTVHNVNAGRRDSKDTRWNRVTLRIQYRLADHLFAHTDKMKAELNEEFGVPKSRVTVVPFGINNAVPNTSLTPAAAKQRLGLEEHEKAILFFGNIAPYKGLEYLVAAFHAILHRDRDYRLLIAGRPKDCEEYWERIHASIRGDLQSGKILLKAQYISDEETEIYFKGSDVLVLPYTHIYQSGVLFLAHSFGLPVLAADVGSLKNELVEGQNGSVFRTADSVDLARAIERYFASDLFDRLDRQRGEIRERAAKEHSWETVGRMTIEVYAGLLRLVKPSEMQDRESSEAGLV
jgi:glycosyltransferase involved in cell wall biosynthesis